ncbi:MAG: diacylglycerol kinase family protein [Candidatus Margulisbacteria bacterium]|jgi:diacylglycerol kinase|nr:diacylglycerol kinase family protein [Candidatus Margulisiibacteriota bacterium]
MKFHNRHFLRSLSCALHGLAQAARYEANMRIHLVCAALAAGAGLILKILPYEWLMLLLTITLVIFAELMNTALEANVDLVTKKKKHEARIAKDVAAAAVLITALNALVVGLIIFAPKIFPGV